MNALRLNDGVARSLFGERTGEPGELALEPAAAVVGHSAGYGGHEPWPVVAEQGEDELGHARHRRASALCGERKPARMWP